MKILSNIIVCAMAFIIFHIADVNNAAANEYLGDFCWNFSFTNNGNPVSGIVKLGISHIGGGHCLVSGVMTVTSPAVLQFTTFGNLEFVGNEIRATLTNQGKRYSDQNNYTVGIDMSTITLNPQTLNGSIEGFGIYSGASETSNGSVTFTTCP